MQVGKPRLATYLPVMLLQVTELSETLLTEGASVGFHSSMDADVLGQVAGVCKGLGAMGAFVGL